MKAFWIESEDLRCCEIMLVCGWKCVERGSASMEAVARLNVVVGVCEGFCTTSPLRWVRWNTKRTERRFVHEHLRAGEE